MTVLMAGILAGMAGMALAGVTPATIRVFGIQRDSFDYVFQSYPDGPDGQTVFSFSHRNGRAYSAKVGEKVEDYQVVQFEPGTQEVLNPRTRAETAVRTGKVTLRGADGKTVTLEQGKWLELTGWRAELVALDTGARWGVREGDSISDGGQALRVVTIWPDEVVVNFGRGDARVARITAEEKTALATRWQREQEARRRQELLAEQRRLDVEIRQSPVQVAMGQNAVGVGNAAAGRVVGVSGSQPRMFIGTEYRYPTAYEIYYLPQGTNRAIRPLVIPKAFKTRMLGGSIGPGRDFTWTSVSPDYDTGSPGMSPRSPMSPYPLPRFSRFEYRVKP